jgi:hypothetical protein
VNEPTEPDDAFVFLVPGFEVDAEPAIPRSDPDLQRQSLTMPSFLRRTKEVSITPERLEKFWKEKVVGLTQTLNRAQAEKKTEGFQIDEISFSLGVGAKGGVAFVAEGSIEATVSITLRRATS